MCACRSAISWDKKAAAELKALNAAGRVCLKDGDTKAYDGYPGNWFVSASSKTQPQIFDRDTTPISDESVGRPYGGCKVYAWITVWVQDNQFGKRINASIERVQFAADGTPFSGTSRASLGAVEAIEDEDFADLV